MDVLYTHKAAQLFIITLTRKDHECGMDVYCESAGPGWDPTQVSWTDMI